MKWKSIHNKIPCGGKGGKWVLICSEEYPDIPSCMAIYSERKSRSKTFFDPHGECILLGVTHWMDPPTFSDLNGKTSKHPKPKLINKRKTL